ncbi:hypothetical protein GLOIN_2v1773103 [Rhizophagus clarus]|uniref:Uncharacterized protein n=1 Tax=Rhizophagus clarus TaxID=94130 RepID=A0A8H3L6X7_9GLOM|nr:hypothetical protein GLOIN_2v1773103 [Rhizophagus clarus]
MSTQITRGENETEFNITMSPVISNPKDLNDKNCKEFNVIIVGFIEFKGKVFQVPPSVEMSVTDLSTGTKLGNVNGDLELEQEIILNVNVPNGETFMTGNIKLYMQAGMIVRLKYDINGGTSSEILLTYNFKERDSLKVLSLFEIYVISPPLLQDLITDFTANKRCHLSNC